MAILGLDPLPLLDQENVDYLITFAIIRRAHEMRSKELEARVGLL